MAVVRRVTDAALLAEEILQEELTALELEEDEEEEMAEAEADEVLSLDTERVTKEGAHEQPPPRAFTSWDFCRYLLDMHSSVESSVKPCASAEHPVCVLLCGVAEGLSPSGHPHWRRLHCTAFEQRC